MFEGTHFLRLLSPTKASGVTTCVNIGSFHLIMGDNKMQHVWKILLENLSLTDEEPKFSMLEPPTIRNAGLIHASFML